MAKRRRSRTPRAEGGDGVGPTRTSRALDALEARLRRLRGRLREPRVQYAVMAGLLLLAVFVRIGPAVDPADWFQDHPDERTYFNQAYAGYLRSDEFRRTPLAHGGSGLPLLFERVFRLAGVEGGDVLASDDDPLTPGQHDAARLLYATTAVAGAGLVLATWLLARQLFSGPVALVPAALIALDPFSVFLSGSLMTEPLYATCAVLSVAIVLVARRRPLRLLWLAPVLAFAYMLRANGVVLAVTVFLFALLLLRAWKPGNARWQSAVAAGLLLVLLVPYVGWRADFLPSGFDYGSNSRFWSDNRWDFQDDYWQNYTMKEGGPRETMSDYFATHTWREAWERAWGSIVMMVQDLVGYGGMRPHPPGTALPFLVSAPAALTFVWWPRRREHWFLPLLLATTMATFFWIYPSVRSVRYFAPLIPLAAVLAVPALGRLASMQRRPLLFWWGYLALFGVLFGVRLLATAVLELHRLTSVLGPLLWGTATLLILLLAPYAWVRWVRGGEPA